MSGFISVIMAEHNTEITTLKNSINSILSQTYTNFEFIIIDDVTSDENIKYLHQLQSENNKVRIISNDINLGLAASLNKAIENARGEYIFRMDTDDIAMPERFEKQLDILTKKNEYITTARVIVIDENNKKIKTTKYLPFYNLIKRFLLYFLFSNGVVHPLIAARKEVFDEYRYDESLKYGQDFELWLRMKEKYKIYFDKKILLKYRTKKEASDKEKILYQLKNHGIRTSSEKCNYIKRKCLDFSHRRYRRSVCKRLNINEQTLDQWLNRLPNID